MTTLKKWYEQETEENETVGLQHVVLEAQMAATEDMEYILRRYRYTLIPVAKGKLLEFVRDHLEVVYETQQEFERTYRTARIADGPRAYNPKRNERIAWVDLTFPVDDDRAKRIRKTVKIIPVSNNT